MSLYTDVELDEELALSRVRTLNDETRRFLPFSRCVLSRGITALSAELRQDIIERVRSYDDFTAVNDPFGEHDYGSFECGEERVLWKIDYYDADGEQYGSPDPADRALTTRVLTIMLASEY